MTESEIKILNVISSNPNGIKAKDIAKILGKDKSEINSILYGNSLKTRIHQDNNFRWFINGAAKTNITKETIEQPDAILKNLCQYYLACISADNDQGISVFKDQKYTPNYVQINSLDDFQKDENANDIISRATRSNNLSAHIGYPIQIYKFHSRDGREFWKIAPVFLFPIDFSGTDIRRADVPTVNMETINQYSKHDSNSRIYDLIALQDELGLNSIDEDFDIEDLSLRLQHIRQWNWRDVLNPVQLTTKSISDINEEGIFNAAVFIVTEKSQYTAGLESELATLMNTPESSYKGTALYNWLHGDLDIISDNKRTDILEVLPLNIEQEEAIQKSLRDELTIIAGPPGTGKSQVVTDLIINMAWRGKSVIFSSKNNKAVDVVATRVNGFGKRPILLRIGNTAVAQNLADTIDDLLSVQRDKNDYIEYQKFYEQYKSIVDKCNKYLESKEQTLSARNKVDKLECEIEELRKRYSFAAISDNEATNISSLFESIKNRFQKIVRLKNSLFGKIFLLFNEFSMIESLSSETNQLNERLKAIRVQSINHNKLISSEQYAKMIIAEINDLVDDLSQILEYNKALQVLQKSIPLEEIDRKIYVLREELNDVASVMWEKWLLSSPLNLDYATERKMREFISGMKLLGQNPITDFPDLKKLFNSIQTDLAKLIPCWAVTSLSVKSRVPFTPGLFDLLVIDEASQCDIASAIPLLYRAKRAVIIGDRKQLKHITSLSQQQDLKLTTRYGINPIFSYTTHSLKTCANALSSRNKIQLRDHHRSFGDIIKFSDKEFYDGTLRVATKYENLKTPSNEKAGIRWMNVEGIAVRPRSGGAYNEAEILATLNELQRLVSNGYKGSIGVVTPFRVQAEKIREAIEKNESLNAQLLKNDILVDTVHKFQGDEKDLMLFSTVVSNGIAEGSLGFLEKTGNLFNVAITRARAVLVVVGNKNYCSHCGVSYLEHFVQYINSLSTIPNDSVKSIELGSEYPEIPSNCVVSDWEIQFYKELYRTGIQTIPQYHIDKYYLDLAIIKGNRKLDIEVDGEMYHRDWNGELCYRDQLRNQRLFELGWDVKRFWVYQIRDNMDWCVSQIKEWINK